jgi:5-methylcytosine-specific restriction endonuclease McrA
MAIDYSASAIPKPTPRIVDRIARKRDLGIQERACRKHVKRRDEGKCRACGRRGSHMHHLERRSLGGKWTPRNVCLTCVPCHQFEHAALLQMRGNPEPGELLTIDARGAARAYLQTGPLWR